MAADSRKYVIKVAQPPNPEKGFTKTSWIGIGYGTETSANGKLKVLCTISAIPLNWNGEFVLFEKDPDYWKNEGRD